uniref:2-oxo-4-hydroxy-4-carboxy-5-ureidoimidazoline decarboxylase n=1 Tax=Culex pipiens TaxID=7175 RepID=A0A8D8GE21_CULPI
MFSKLTMELLNSLSAKEFHTTFGNVVECHPEPAVACSKKLPFASVDAVIATFDDYLQQLNVETKTRVLRSFPDLAGKLLDSHQLTEESTYEHACAGLDKLMAEDRDKLTTLNRKYQDKFGFPFVICAREASRFEAILNGITTRIHNLPEQELETGIGEAKKICRLRILQLVERD